MSTFTIKNGREKSLRSTLLHHESSKKNEKKEKKETIVKKKCIFASCLFSIVYSNV